MINTTIAHYQIAAMLGQGGMGEVYRATDTKLNREVPIKVLPESFARDKERLARRRAPPMGGDPFVCFGLDEPNGLSFM